MICNKGFCKEAWRSAAPPNNNKRPRQRSAAPADGRDCRRAQAGQHNEAVSEPRTSWRGSAASQSAGLLDYNANFFCL